MKILIFAGGAGTRFWPLSKQGFPKQFIKMFNGKSTLQLTVDRLKNDFPLEDIYVSTNDKYIDIVAEQLPNLKKSNIVGEPEKRGLTAAIGYNLMRVKKLGGSGPAAILWADHLMENEQNFVEVLKKGESILKENPEKMVFVGEEPRYANNNLGYVHIGDEIDKGVHKFLGWYYKPPLDECKEMFKSGEWKWNPGYFIFDLDFLLKQFKTYVPEVYEKTEKICEKAGTEEEVKLLKEIYPTIEKSNWEKKIIEKLPAESGVVVRADMGWSDPGTLYALKESQVRDLEKNLTEGNVLDVDTKDSLIINKEDGKVVATVGLEGMIVVNTKDSIIVVHKDNVLKTTELVEKLKEKPEWEKFA